MGAKLRELVRGLLTRKPPEALPPVTLPSSAERRFEEASQGAKSTRSIAKWTWRW